MSEGKAERWVTFGVVGDIEVARQNDDGSVTPICGVYHEGRSSGPKDVATYGEARRIADLIAATPALLHACKMIMQASDSGRGVFMARCCARDAIAQAREKGVG